MTFDMDNIPVELLVAVFSEVDDPVVMCKLQHVCRRWNNVINTYHTVWKSACRKKISSQDIEVEQLQEHNWQKILEKYYKKSLVISQWQEGKFNSATSFSACNFNVNDWGSILEALEFDAL